MLRDGTIGKFAVDLMLSQPSLTNERVLAEVRKKFPHGQTQMASIYWYRAWIKRNVKPADGDEELTDPDVDDLVDEAIETTFGLERDLQNALRANIDQLESGLTIIDGGKEQKVASGLIDITARDRSGATVIIELKKAGASDRQAIGQILGYMGDLMEGTEAVRGILVAGEFSPRTIAAARAVPNLGLVKYSFKFSFETISRDKT
jgi:hypothetical protein